MEIRRRISKKLFYSFMKIHLLPILWRMKYFLVNIMLNDESKNNKFPTWNTHSATSQVTKHFLRKNPNSPASSTNSPANFHFSQNPRKKNCGNKRWRKWASMWAILLNNTKKQDLHSSHFKSSTDYLFEMVKILQKWTLPFLIKML